MRRDDIAGKITDKSGKDVGHVTGSWLSHLDIDGTRYWDIERDKPLRHIPERTPLPSDWRYREDLIWLHKGDLDRASAWK